MLLTKVVTDLHASGVGVGQQLSASWLKIDLNHSLNLARSLCQFAGNAILSMDQVDLPFLLLGRNRLGGFASR